MKTVIRIVKRNQQQPVVAAEDVNANQPRPTDLVKTVKSWVTESRERRSVVDYPLWLKQAREEIKAVKQTGGRIVLGDPVAEPAG